MESELAEAHSKARGDEKMIAWLNKQLTAAQLGGARLYGATPAPPTPAAAKGTPLGGGGYASSAVVGKAWVLPAQHSTSAGQGKLAAGAGDGGWSPPPRKPGWAPGSSPAKAAAMNAPQLATPTH